MPPGSQLTLLSAASCIAPPSYAKLLQLLACTLLSPWRLCCEHQVHAGQQQHMLLLLLLLLLLCVDSAPKQLGLHQPQLCLLLPYPLAHALHIDHIVAAEVLLNVLIHILPPRNQRLHQMPQMVLCQQPDALQSIHPGWPHR
jgi:hypothetical protein